MYCVNCGKMISNNCKFCPSCGTKTDFFQNNQVNKVYHFEYSQLSEKNIIIEAEFLDLLCFNSCYVSSCFLLVFFVS